MTPEEMKKRTKAFALRTIRVVSSLGGGSVPRVLGNQLLRCGTSVGASYRAACRGRSAAEFSAKLGIVEEELDESIYWMELLIKEKLVPPSRLQPLLNEADELLRIVVSSIKTARSKKTRRT